MGIKRFGRTKGFTLVELVIYSGVLVLVAGGFIGVMLESLKGATSQVSEGEAFDQLDNAVRTIDLLVKESSYIDIATSTPTSTLVLRMKSPCQDIAKVYVDSDKIAKLERTATVATDPVTGEACSSETKNITSPKVSVDQLSFTKRSDYPAKDQVNTSLQVSAKGTAKIWDLLSSSKRVAAATFDSDVLPGLSTQNLGTPSSPWHNAYLSTAGGSINDLLYFSGSSVGVGTINPNYKLDVVGDINYTGALRQNGVVVSVGGGSSGIGGSGTANYVVKWSAATSTTNSIIYDDGSNVGIGKSNPTQQLEVSKNILLPTAVSNTNGNLFLGGDTSTGANGTRLFSLDSAGGGFIDVKGSAASKGLIFRVDTVNGGTERMRIAADGNVGIGTSTPSQKLDVNGNIKGTGLCIGSDCRTSWPSSSAPAGTWCGIGYVYEFTGLGYLQKACQGLNPAVSCPSGYSRFNHRTEGTAPYRYFHYGCFKD